MATIVTGSSITTGIANTKVSPAALLYEYVVTGSAATSINVTGLDINTHKSYRIEMELINATASHAQTYIYINGDTTATNYYHQLIYGYGSNTAAQRLNTPNIVYLDASTISNAVAKLSLNGSGYANWSSVTSDYSSSSVRVLTVGGSKITAVVNITQLTFACSVTSGFAVGSKIRIYRGDL